VNATPKNPQIDFRDRNSVERFLESKRFRHDKPKWRRKSARLRPVYVNNQLLFHFDENFIYVG